MDSHPSTIHHVVINHHNTVRGAREPPEKCNTKCAFDIILDQFRCCISLFNSLWPYSECTLVWLYGMLHCGKWAAAAKVTATTQNSNSNNCVCVCGEEWTIFISVGLANVFGKCQQYCNQKSCASGKSFLRKLLSSISTVCDVCAANEN